MNFIRLGSRYINLDNVEEVYTNRNGIVDIKYVSGRVEQIRDQDCRMTILEHLDYIVSAEADEQKAELKGMNG